MLVQELRRIEGGPSGELSRIVAALARARTCLVTMHRGPDGDALGSALALAEALREWGKEVVVYSADGVPSGFRFLVGADRVVRELGITQRFDVSITCDAGDATRLGPDFPPPERRGLLVNVDHHPTTPSFGDLNYIDASAAAVGVIVARILDAAGRPITKAIGTGILCSLVTDTGSFRYPNTNGECLRLAARLVELGVDPWEVGRGIYESQTPARIRLLALVLGSLTLSPCGRFAWVDVTRVMREEAGTDEETEGGFVNQPRSVAGVEVALCFREQEGGMIRVSLRSRGRVDVSAIAIRHGGGGHHNAAGCAVPGPLPEARERLFVAVRAALAEG